MCIHHKFSVEFLFILKLLNSLHFFDADVLALISRSCTYPYIDMKEESSILVLGLLTRYQLGLLLPFYFSLELRKTVCYSPLRLIKLLC